MVIFMGSSHKTAFRSKMTVPFAVLSDSTRGTPCFPSVPEDFLITFFFMFIIPLQGSVFPFVYTWGWERAPIGFYQWWSSSSWKTDGDWHQTLHTHFQQLSMQPTLHSQPLKISETIRTGIGPTADLPLHRTMSPGQPQLPFSIKAEHKVY